MATDSKVKLKLLIDKSIKKVLFAEAGKDFIDFLFHLLSLPVGTVVKLLKGNSMVGCLATLYESIENLNETYIQPNQNKDVVLNPRSPLCASEIPLKLTYYSGTSKTGKFYGCNHSDNQMFYASTASHKYMTDAPNVTCPACNRKMTIELHYVAPTTRGNNEGAEVTGGFVKGVVTYMVMDDLEMKPMSTISSITMLNKFNVKDVGALEERVIELGVKEGLNLLKASLQCKTVLTSVFLGNMGA